MRESPLVTYSWKRFPLEIFSLSDACRTGAKEAINEIKSMGIKTAMLTGDSNEAATLAQNQVKVHTLTLYNLIDMYDPIFKH